MFAAAVVLDPDRPIRGLDDSKQLEPERREVLAERIRERAVPGPWAPPTPSRSTASIFFKPRGWPCGAPSTIDLCMRLSAGGCGHGGRYRSRKKPLDPRRRAVFLHRRRLDPGQGRPRRGACRVGPRVPRIWSWRRIKATARRITSRRSSAWSHHARIASVSSRCETPAGITSGRDIRTFGSPERFPESKNRVSFSHVPDAGKRAWESLTAAEEAFAGESLAPE